MIAQIDLVQLGNDPKTWLVIIGGLLVSLIVGRFVQAFKNGEGVVGAAKAVWLGTNTPKPTQQPGKDGPTQPNPSNPDRIV